MSWHKKARTLEPDPLALNLSMSLASYVTLNKMFNLSVPQFLLSLYNSDNDNKSAYVIMLL